MENWKPVVGYENTYHISDLGRVKRVKGLKSTWAGRILKPVRNWQGYCRVDLCQNNNRKLHSVHLLVLEAFVKPRPSSRHDANHKDGVKANNCLSNLEWVTKSQNNKHAVDTKLRRPMRGEEKPRAKLTEHDVRSIHSLYATGQHTQKDIASRFGVKQCTISLVLSGRNWAHLHPSAVEESLPPRKCLSDEDVAKLRRLHNEEGISRLALSKQYNVSISAVSAIVAGISRS